MAATPLKTADVDAMIKQAVKDNDITPDEANDLRVRYKNDPQGLHSIINDHARKRLQYLESLSFPEIDKKDGLAEELIRRDYATYRKKYVAYYGKEPKALDAKVASDKDMQKEINNLESMLVRDGRTTQGQADFIRKGNTNDPNNHLKILHGIANSKREAYENESWDKLDRAGKLEELKTNHLDLFKQKYREKFGKDYQGN